MSNSYRIPGSRRKTTPRGTDGKSARLRHTNWFVTINTNRQCQEGSEEAPEQIKRLREVMKKIFVPEFIERYVVLAKTAVEGSQIDDVWIKLDECGIWWAVEIGPSTKKLHAHACVLIPHYTLIRINERAFKEDLDREMAEAGWPDYYHHGQYTKEAGTTEEALKAYIAKNPVN